MAQMCLSPPVPAVLLGNDAFVQREPGEQLTWGTGKNKFKLSNKLNSAAPFGRSRHVKKGQGRLNLFANITGFLFPNRLLNSTINEAINELDRDLDGTITQQDLETFVTSRGLPAAYIPAFMDAVLGETNQGSGSRSVKHADSQEAPELTLGAFERFVRSRETALRRTFNVFDKDNDGVISVEDLEASLAHVVVVCPRTRCLYRCPRALARAMVQRTAAVGAGAGAGHQGDAEAERSSYSRVDFDTFRRFFMLLPTTDMAVEYWLRAGAAPELTDTTVLHNASESRTSAWGHLFAGAVAGAASRTATAPLETLRLAVMTGSVQTTNLVEAAGAIVREQGWKGLYAGNAINVIRSAPQKALDFFAFDTFKSLLRNVGGGSKDPDAPLSPVITLLAAGLAGMTSWATLYPLETLRARVTAGTVARGVPLHMVMHQIVAQEGPMALYRGLGWSLSGIFPEAALCYGLHDLLKDCYRKHFNGREPGVMMSLSFGVLSAFAGQLVSFPLETVARRLQVQQGGGGLARVLKEIFAQGGPLALYRGVGAATVRLVPMAIVSFGTYEMVRAMMIALEDARAAQDAEQEYWQLHTFCEPLTTGAPKRLVGPGASACELVTPAAAAAVVAAVAPCAQVALPAGASAPTCSTCPQGGPMPVSAITVTPCSATAAVPACAAAVNGDGSPVGIQVVSLDVAAPAGSSCIITPVTASGGGSESECTPCAPIPVCLTCTPVASTSGSSTAASAATPPSRNGGTAGDSGKSCSS